MLKSKFLKINNPNLRTTERWVRLSEIVNIEQNEKYNVDIYFGDKNVGPINSLRYYYDSVVPDIETLIFYLSEDVVHYKELGVKQYV